MSRRGSRRTGALGGACLALLAGLLCVASCSTNETNKPPSPSDDCQITAACEGVCDPSNFVCSDGVCACKCFSRYDCYHEDAICKDGLCASAPQLPNGASCHEDGIIACQSTYCIHGRCREHGLLAGEPCKSGAECDYGDCGDDGKCACVEGGGDLHSTTAPNPACEDTPCPSELCCSKSYMERSRTSSNGHVTTVDTCLPTSGLACKAVFACDQGEDCFADHCCVPPFKFCERNDECCYGNCTDNLCDRGPTGLPCTDPVQCLSTLCSDGHCACDLVGASCDVGITCCSGTCLNGACVCGGSGASCGQASDCCGGICSGTPGSCACSAPGAACYATTDCCVGSCQGGACTCSPNGAVCADGHLCCSGTCESGSCVCAPKGSWCATGSTCCSGTCSNDSCACAATGSDCATGDDCCSGSCASGQCQCAPTGAPCTDGALCCSGTCEGGGCG